MAKATYIQCGDAIDYTPATDVAAGDVIVLGALLAISKKDIKANHLGALAVVGVFDIAKEAGGGVVFSFGDLAYWDDVSKLAVTSDGGGANKLLGHVVEAAADGDNTVRVRLCPGGSVSTSSSSSSSGI